jgi:photosystem II stability/assembly factor-like uncharacterized protein
MKIFLSLLILLFSFSSDAQWNLIPSPSASTISVDYVSSTIYIGSANGTFYRSDNIGQSWFSKPAVFSNSFRSVSFTPTGIGYACDPLGTSRSLDNGNTWSAPNSITGGVAFISFAPGNYNVAYAPGGNVNKSTNIGQSYIAVATPSIYTISGHVIDANNVYLCGRDPNIETIGEIARTNDGGINWVIKSFIGSSTISSVYFYDVLTGWAGSIDGDVFLTLDGGNNWSPLGTLPFSIRDIYFKDAFNGWAVGDGGNIYHTSNSGGNWAKQPSGTTQGLSKIAFNNVNNSAVIVGSNGTILHSTNGGGVLPVSLNHFYGKAVENSILLSWQTASEQNNKQFDIERFYNNNWQTIATLDGKGNSNLPVDYNFTDERPLQGINKYRLKQTDIDGKFTYSQILSVKMQYDKTEMSISPNPAKDNIVISYVLPADAVVQMNLINAHGQKLRTLLNAKQQAGSYTLNVTGNTLTKGIYFVRMAAGNKTITKKIYYVP